eukprot:gene2981-biopygen3966
MQQNEAWPGTGNQRRQLAPAALLADEGVGAEAELVVETTPIPPRLIPARELKKGMLCVVRGRPARAVEVRLSRTGRRGRPKVLVAARDIFTGAKLEEMWPAVHNVEIPFIEKEVLDVASFDAAASTLQFVVTSPFPVPSRLEIKGA